MNEPLIKTFCEHYLEHRGGPAAEWTEGSRAQHIDRQISDWVKKNKTTIMSVKVSMTLANPEAAVSDTELVATTAQMRSCTLHYVVLYKASGDPVTAEEDENLGEPLPLPKDAKAPTVEVIRTEGLDKRPAQAMAGIFGVPEGTKFHPDDTCLAPVPLLSPDFSFKPWISLFGNVKG